MKVIITVKRITEYSSIVEMDERTFQRLNNAETCEQAMEFEHELNRLIDIKDCQDNEFYQLVEFEKLEDDV